MQRKPIFSCVVRPTREYVAGIVGGCGLGLIIGRWLDNYWDPILGIVGSGLIVTGSLMALWAQRSK